MKLRAEKLVKTYKGRDVVKGISVEPADPNSW